MGRQASYGFRHLWISEMLMAGVDVLLVARMAGTSVAMIERSFICAGLFRANGWGSPYMPCAISVRANEGRLIPPNKDFVRSHAASPRLETCVSSGGSQPNRDAPGRQITAQKFCVGFASERTILHRSDFVPSLAPAIPSPLSKPAPLLPRLELSGQTDLGPGGSPRSRAGTPARARTGPPTGSCGGS